MLCLLVSCMQVTRLMGMGAEENVADQLAGKLEDMLAVVRKVRTGLAAVTASAGGAQQHCNWQQGGCVAESRPACAVQHAGASAGHLRSLFGVSACLLCVYLLPSHTGQ